MSSRAEIGHSKFDHLDVVLIDLDLRLYFSIWQQPARETEFHLSSSTILDLHFDFWYM